MTNVRRVSCGVDFCSVPDLNTTLSVASEAGYHFCCVPIVHPRIKREFQNPKLKTFNEPFTRSDLILTGGDWGSIIVGKISHYLEPDSKCEVVSKASERSLMRELMYASHLGLPAIMLTLHGLNNTNMARIVHSKLVANSSYQVWVRVPMQNVEFEASLWRSDIEFSEDEIAARDGEPWEWWNRFYLECNQERMIGVALEVTADIPSDLVIERWLGEPVKCLVFSTSVFMTNKRGYPVLSKAHQQVVRKFAPLNVQIIITGYNRHDCIKYYQQYLDHLWQTQRKNDPLSNYARGYEDYLQCPLQPLMDNLESQTYEVFEKDPVKYTEYQRAIYNVLVDKIPYEEKDEKTLVIMVVGAGRGPLVRASINASKKADRMIRVYAVEKNPNAVVTLLALKEEMWGEQVTVVSCDMRDWKAPEKADLIVSELLGSFGDNELSPECLDGAQKFLSDDGIIIPQKYTSYIAPVQSAKLYNEVRQCTERYKHPLNQFETAYVVHLQNRTELAPPVPLFSFEHPRDLEESDNTRYAVRTFSVKQNCVLHGFAGYFDTVLYKDVTLSILPETHSQGMFSWFSIFFPIKEPICVKPDEEIEVHFWRLANPKIVWYEWSVSRPAISTIHNPNGRSYNIGL